MTRWCVVALPSFTRGEAQVEAWRREHDAAMAARIGAHLTLVFPQSLLAEDALLEHVREAVAGVPAFEFHCRRAVVETNTVDGLAYVFIVPDEGREAFEGLHDRLYRGALAPALRLDLPYEPHFTVGRFPGAGDAQSVRDSLDSRGLELAGRVDRLTLVAVEGDRIEVRAAVVLPDS